MAITPPEFENLIDKMRTTGKLKTIKDQLVCASELVFHGGVTMGEIPQLTVGDVLDKKDEIVQYVDKFEKTITINGKKVNKPLRINEKMKTSLRDYLKTPELNLRLVPLPGYSPDFNADEAIWDWVREEVTGNTCLGTKARVQERVGNFFQGLGERANEVKQRCRTVLQAKVEHLMVVTGKVKHQPEYVDPTLALV